MKKLKWISLGLVLVSGAAHAESYSQQIVSIASSSSCASYSWKNRGQAPMGYIKGVALSFARSLCRLHANSPYNEAANVMSMADTKRDVTDALAHYSGVFKTANMPIDVAGENSMRADFTLGLGLGMRESSGAYCEGWDTSAGSRRPSSAAEAGLFQTSYDSMGATGELQLLYAEYQNNTNRCLLNVFEEQASCRPQSILGTGAGADFQRFNKACPAFATEYAMTLLRVLRGHFGPINRREAEVKTTCNAMLVKVQQVIDANLSAACQELF
jgi:hypothetical protein